MNTSLSKQLIQWAEKWVPIFNELAAQHKAHYNTQSPLIGIDSPIDVMMIGINPKGPLRYENGTNLNPSGFLAGNLDWTERFNDKWNFIIKGRWFMGYDSRRTNLPIDDDKKTVWCNLTPFVSDKGFTDLPAELVNTGIKSMFELITILKPRKIVLLTSDGFKQLTDKKVDNELKEMVIYTPLFEKPNLQIGEINGTPTICVSHPSGKWAVSNKFIPILILLHELSYKDANGKKRVLEEVKDIMRKEIALWLEQIKL